MRACALLFLALLAPLAVASRAAHASPDGDAKARAAGSNRRGATDAVLSRILARLTPDQRAWVRWAIRHGIFTAEEVVATGGDAALMKALLAKGAARRGLEDALQLALDGGLVLPSQAARAREDPQFLKDLIRVATDGELLGLSPATIREVQAVYAARGGDSGREAATKLLITTAARENWGISLPPGVLDRLEEPTDVLDAVAILQAAGLSEDQVRAVLSGGGFYADVQGRGLDQALLSGIHRVDPGNVIFNPTNGWRWDGGSFVRSDPAAERSRLRDAASGRPGSRPGAGQAAPKGGPGIGSTPGFGAHSGSGPRSGGGKGAGSTSGGSAPAGGGGASGGTGESSPSGAYDPAIWDGGPTGGGGGGGRSADAGARPAGRSPGRSEPGKEGAAGDGPEGAGGADDEAAGMAEGRGGGSAEGKPATGPRKALGTWTEEWGDGSGRWSTGTDYNDGSTDLVDFDQAGNVVGRRTVRGTVTVSEPYMPVDQSTGSGSSVETTPDLDRYASPRVAQMIAAAMAEIHAYKLFVRQRTAGSRANVRNDGDAVPYGRGGAPVPVSKVRGLLQGDDRRGEERRRSRPSFEGLRPTRRRGDVDPPDPDQR